MTRSDESFRRYLRIHLKVFELRLAGNLSSHGASIVYGIVFLRFFKRLSKFRQS